MEINIYCRRLKENSNVEKVISKVISCKLQVWHTTVDKWKMLGFYTSQKG